VNRTSSNSAPRFYSIKQALSSANEKLTVAHKASPRLDAETLLMFTLACDRAYLYAHPERILTTEEQARFDHAIAERLRGVPTQYISGHQEFWGMDFIVNPSVLIPRPETEHLIEAALPLARALRNPRIVDMGTGSGCIALALAKELPDAEIFAVDISAAALEVARANAEKNHLGERVQFQQSDLLEGFAANSVDIVVSNPPYVGDEEEDTVQREVREFEPRNAVFAGPNGTEVIAKLIPQARHVLKSGRWLLMEVSGTIAKDVIHLLRDWENVQVINDLQEIQRVVLAKKR
jgi:release factor glutamine methyltransferase